MTNCSKGIFLLLLLFLFQGCVKDLQDIEDIKVENWEPEVAVALVNSTISIQDVLDDFDDEGYLSVDGDNFMTVVYQGNVFSTSGDEVVTMPDFSIPMIDTSMVVPYGMIDTPFDIDFFTVKSGQLDFSFESPYTEDIDVVFEVRNLTQNGTSLQFTEEANYTGSSPMIVGGSIDLTNYIMDFVGDVIEVRYIAKDAMGDRKYLNNVMLDFRDFKYEFAQGYFSQYEFDLPADTVLLDIFNNSVSGNLHIENPKINLIVTNSFGLPIQMEAENLTANTMTGGMMDLNTVLSDGIAFNYPTLLEVGENKTTTIEINGTNSNLSEVLSNVPQEIFFEMDALSNPDNDPNIKGFVKDDSQFDIDVEIEIPLFLRAENFVIEEVNDFDASFFDDVQSAEFKLITENGLPLEAGVQVYFLNENNMVLDSLFTASSETLIPAGEVDTDGKVTKSGMGEKTAEISGTRIENFRNATQISIQGIVSTSEGGSVPVKFYTDYNITFKLGVKAKLEE